ncbi:hypothetical protein BS78_01G270600 [Paspalum vaginatum]|nr:hypothetical protein BS78_01G270600 [Paspalum vaginatum]
MLLLLLPIWRGGEVQEGEAPWAAGMERMSRRGPAWRGAGGAWPAAARRRLREGVTQEEGAGRREEQGEAQGGRPWQPGGARPWGKGRPEMDREGGGAMEGEACGRGRPRGGRCRFFEKRRQGAVGEGSGLWPTRQGEKREGLVGPKCHRKEEK